MHRTEVHPHTQRHCIPLICIENGDKKGYIRKKARALKMEDECRDLKQQKNRDEEGLEWQSVGRGDVVVCFKN